MEGTPVQNVKFATVCAFLVAFTTLINPSVGSSNGAPLAACETLGDPHVVFPSQPVDESPFGVFLSKEKIDSGETVGITLAALENNDADSFFKGYMIMAFDRSNESGGPIGMFDVVQSKGQYLSCYEQPKSAVTHVNNNFKREIQLDWHAPLDFDGEVVFKATFVGNYWTFWASVPSEVLIVGAEDLTTELATTTTTKESITESSTTTTTKEPITESSTTTITTEPITESSTTTTTSTTSKPTTPNSTWFLKPSIASTLVLLLLTKTLNFCY